MADEIDTGKCALVVLRHMVKEKIIEMPFVKEYRTLREIESHQENKTGEVRFNDVMISAFWKDEFGRALLEHTPSQMVIPEKGKYEIALTILEYWISK